MILEDLRNVKGWCEDGGRLSGAIMEQYEVCIVRMPTIAAMSAMQLNERSLLRLFESSRNRLCGK